MAAVTVLPAAGVAPPGPGCVAGARPVAELSGLVAQGPPGAPPSVYRAIVDGGGDARVYTLDPGTCAITEVREAPVRVTDVEDLGSTPDGSLWLADTGDNEADRATVRLVELPPTGPARVHELSYPDGPRDAEAILLSDDRVPLIVDKTTGAAGVYRPTVPLDRTSRGGPVPLARVADVVLPYSATAGGPLGAAGSRTVTGGAVQPPGDRGGGARVLALRTYTDAWLFALPSGAADADSLVRAVHGAPLAVGLPDEAQGEAVALDARGTLHSGTEARGTAPAAVRIVPGAAAAATVPGAPVVAQPATPPEVASYPPWLPAAGAAGAVGLVALVGVAAMLLHGRRRGRSDPR